MHKAAARSAYDRSPMNEPVISVRALTKVYRVHEREEGLRASLRSMRYTREHKQEALPILAKEFPGMDRNTLAGTLDFYLKAMSPDGRVSDNVVREMINEQRALLNVKNEVPITQVADFSPLQRVVKELNPSQ